MKAILPVDVRVSNAFINLILPSLVLQRTNKVIAERVTRYIEDKLRARVSILLCIDEGFFKKTPCKMNFNYH